jgi:mRNA-degrading endonuclease RelE of RelBE toxin-antitoxin system
MSEKSWGVEFSKSALKALKRLDKTVSPRILDYLESLAEAENPLRQKDVLAIVPRGRAY